MYLFEKFNKRLWRVPLSTGYPCPNRINGKTGCTFCNGLSFLPGYLKDNDSLVNQIERGIKFFSNRYKVDEFYGYFQDNTSTYGDINDLCSKYELVLSKDCIKGLMVSTRPDFIYNELILKLSKLQNKYNKDLWIELGLQSVYNETLKKINRNHSYEDFKDAVKIIKDNSNIKVTVHMIIGLQNETPEIILNGIKKMIKENKIDGIKFRLLEVLPDTKIAADYEINPDDFYKFDINSYSKLLCDLLEIIPKNVVVMRLVNFKSLQILSGNSLKKISKLELLNEVNKIFSERKTYQGIHYEQI